MNTVLSLFSGFDDASPIPATESAKKRDFAEKVRGFNRAGCIGDMRVR